MIERNIISSAISSAIISAIREVQRPQRFFTRFDSGVNSYGEFTSDIVLDGDFEIELTHSTDDTSSITLIGHSANSEDFIWTDQNQLRIRINAGSYSSFGVAPSGIVLSNGKLHTSIISRVAGVISASTDGEAYSTTINDTSTFTINSLAQRSLALHWDGYISNLRVTKAGTLVVNSPMDDAPTATEFANLADPANPSIKRNIADTQTSLFDQVNDGWTGPELWTLPLYTFTGLEASGDILQSVNVLTTGTVYRTTFTGSGANVGVTTGSSGSTRALIGNVSIFADSNPFSVTQDVVATSPTARWQVNGTPPFSGSAGLDSVKEFLEVAS